MVLWSLSVEADASQTVCDCMRDKIDPSKTALTEKGNANGIVLISTYAEVNSNFQYTEHACYKII